MLVSGSGSNGLAIVYDEASERDTLDGEVLLNWQLGAKALGRSEWHRTLRIALREHGTAPWTAKQCKEHRAELLALLRNHDIFAAVILQSPATPGVRQVHSAWNMLGHAGNPYKWAGTAELIDGMYVCPVLHPFNYEHVYLWLIARWLKQAWKLAQRYIDPLEWPELIVSPGLMMRFELENLRDSTMLAVDIETNVAGTIITAIGLANNEMSISVPWDDYVVAGTDGEIERGQASTPTGRIVLDLLASNIPKILHNGAFDVLQLAKRGIALRNFTWDTLLMHRVAYAQFRHSLQQACATEFCVEPWKTLWKPPKVAQEADAWLATPVALRTYNAKDTAATYQLCKHLLPKLGMQSCLTYREKTEPLENPPTGMTK